MVKLSECRRDLHLRSKEELRKSDPNDPHPGIGGVEVNLLPGNIQVVTDQDGYYSFFDLMVGEYTLVPNLSGMAVCTEPI